MEEIEKLPRHIALDADQIAKDLGSARSANMVILGAASPYLEIAAEKFEQAITKIFSRKGQEVVDVNISCFRAGKEFSEKYREM